MIAPPSGSEMELQCSLDLYFPNGNDAEYFSLREHTFLASKPWPVRREISEGGARTAELANYGC